MFAFFAFPVINVLLEGRLLNEEHYRPAKCKSLSRTRVCSLTFFDFDVDSLEDNQICEAWLYLASAIQVGVIFVTTPCFPIPRLSFSKANANEISGPCPLSHWFKIYGRFWHERPHLLSTRWAVFCFASCRYFKAETLTNLRFEKFK